MDEALTARPAGFWMRLVALVVDCILFADGTG